MTEQKEGGIENIIPFAESGQIVPALNMIFDHKWFLRNNQESGNHRMSYHTVLRQHCDKKANEIKQICNQNYGTFINAIDQILQLEHKVHLLRDNINVLNGNIQTHGNGLHSEMQQMIDMKNTQYKIDFAMKEIRKILNALDLFNTIQVLISTRKYVNALKALHLLHTSHLLPLKQYKVCQEMIYLIPELTKKIKTNVLSHFKNWIYESNKESIVLGTIAMEQNRQYLLSVESNAEMAEDEERGASPMAMPLAPSAKTNINKRGDTEESSSDYFSLSQSFNAKEQSNPAMSPSIPAANVAGASSLFERIEALNFLFVYECIHVHTLLGEMTELSNIYKELRKQNRDELLNKSNLSLQQENDVVKYFASVAGFFVMEHAVSTRYQQLIDADEMSIWWDQSIKFLQRRMESELLKPSNRAKTNSAILVKVKNECVILSNILQNYDFKTNVLDSFIQQLRAEFEERISLSLIEKLVANIRKDLLQPLVIRSVQDFEYCVLDFRLDGPVNEEDMELDSFSAPESPNYNSNSNYHDSTKKSTGLRTLPGITEEKETESNVNTNINSNPNPNTNPNPAGGNKPGPVLQIPETFPVTVPFSNSVPKICIDMSEYIEQYHEFAKYLTDMAPHLRNAVSKMVKAIATEMQNIVSTHSTRNELSPSPPTTSSTSGATSTLADNIRSPLGITELAQMAVNAHYLQKACGYFEEQIVIAAGEVVRNKASDNANQTIHAKSHHHLYDEEDSAPKMYEARQSLINVTSQCGDALLTLLTSEIETLLKKNTKYMSYHPESVNALNEKAHDYVTELIDFVQGIIAGKLTYLRYAHQSSAYFLACSRIHAFLFDSLTSEEYSFLNKKINIIGIYNLHLDVKAFEDWSRETGILDLDSTFKRLRVLLDLLLSGSGLLEYLDVETRQAKYNYVLPSDLKQILEKFQTNLGLFAGKLPKHISNLDKKVIKTVLKALESET